MSASSFYSEEELSTLGFASYGKNVLISRNARFYSPGKMNFGDNVRIDDFAMLSGRVTLGDHVHIAVAALIFAGDAGVTIDKYSTLSSRSAIYAISDELAGHSILSPTVPAQYSRVTGKSVHIGRHTAICTGCTVLPGCNVGEGCTIGAMSLVTKPLEPWGMYYGIPATRHGDKSKELLKLEEEYEKSIGKR